jgi:hypothetical protein
MCGTIQNSMLPLLAGRFHGTFLTCFEFQVTFYMKWYQLVLPQTCLQIYNWTELFYRVEGVREKTIF